MKHVLRMSLRTASVALVWPLFAAGLASAQAADYHDLGKRFFELVAQQRPADAVDALFASNSWLQKVPDQIANVKTQYGNLENVVGRFVDSEILIDEQLTKRYAYVLYVAAYERQPLKVEMQFYKPKNEWVLLNFYFSAEFGDTARDLIQAKGVRGKS